MSPERTDRSCLGFGVDTISGTLTQNTPPARTRSLPVFPEKERYAFDGPADAGRLIVPQDTAVGPQTGGWRSSEDNAVVGHALACDYQIKEKVGSAAC